MQQKIEEKGDKFVLVDWLTFTIGTLCLLDVENNDYPYVDDAILQRVRELLGIGEGVEFMFKDRGFYGYKKGFYCGGIRICFGGSDTVMVDLTGEGCRLLESVNKDLDWLELIARVSSFQRHNFSRLDIACDTFGTLNMAQIIRYTLHNRHISRWKLAPRVVQGREETVDFGSPQSRTMLRIYNKTLERQCKLDAGADVPANWVRCELQFRNDAVDSFIREWLECMDISQVYFGIMANQLRFVKRRESNLERSETVAWWRRFLDNSSPIRLAYKGGLAYNLQSLEQYVYIQASSSIKALLVLSDWDVDKLLNMIVHRDMNDKQQALIHTVAAANSLSAPRPPATSSKNV